MLVLKKINDFFMTTYRCSDMRKVRWVRVFLSSLLILNLPLREPIQVWISLSKLTAQFRAREKPCCLANGS